MHPVSSLVTTSVSFIYLIATYLFEEGAHTSSVFFGNDFCFFHLSHCKFISLLFRRSSWNSFSESVFNWWNLEICFFTVSLFERTTYFDHEIVSCGWNLELCFCNLCVNFFYWSRKSALVLL